MAGLLSGLSEFGLDDMENVDIFAEPQKAGAERKKNEAKTVEIHEVDLLFDKSHTCPVCDTKFTNKAVRTGKARMIGQDKDLRPIHEEIDVQKYDIVLCPHCGYAAITSYFPHLGMTQQKAVKEGVSNRIKLHKYEGETYTYAEALDRYKLALVNAVVKHAKASEKAYICLKASWLLRGYAETERLSGNFTKEQLDNLAAMEKSNLENAYKGFMEARQKEPFPLCGMNEVTVDYLLAALGTELGDYETAGKMVGRILSTAGAPARIKDKARDMKEEIMEAMHGK